MGYLYVLLGGCGLGLFSQVFGLPPHGLMVMLLCSCIATGGGVHVGIRIGSKGRVNSKR